MQLVRFKEENMKRVAIAIAVAAVASVAIYGTSKAAPIAQIPAVADRDNLIPAHYYHGHYYQYYWRGRYYRHRHWRHHHWYYW